MSCSTHCFQGEYKYSCKYGCVENCDMFISHEHTEALIEGAKMNLFEKTIKSEYLDFSKVGNEYSNLLTNLCYVSWKTGYENHDMIYEKLYGDD